jgi:hypothetical protein
VWSSDGLFEGLFDGLSEGVVTGTLMPEAGLLREPPTKAKAATETPTASAMPARPNPMIVSVRFISSSLVALVLTLG